MSEKISRPVWSSRTCTTRGLVVMNRGGQVETGKREGRESFGSEEEKGEVCLDGSFLSLKCISI